MTLIPIQHERRLTSPAEAEAWFRALGQKRVSARGFHTTDPARFERLIAAIVPKLEHTISFEGGNLGGAALDALDALATSRFHYLDVRTADANLRIWPEQYSWVDSSRDLAAASAALGVPLAPGLNTADDAQVTVAENGSSYRIHAETKSIATALRMFRPLSGARLDYGFINGVHLGAKPQLVRFLTALATRVHAALELDVAAARALTELYAGEKLEWQADGMLVDFPDGRIHGFLTTPRVGERDREKWQARITKALGRAGL